MLENKEDPAWSMIHDTETISIGVQDLRGAQTISIYIRIHIHDIVAVQLNYYNN